MPRREKGAPMQFKNILVPFDESEHAQAALHLAIDLAGDDSDAAINIVTIVSSDIMPPSMISPTGMLGEAPIDYGSYETLLTSMVERADRELHDSLAGLLGKDMDSIKARLAIETRLAPSPSTALAHMRPTTDATSSSWAAAAWGPCAACSAA